MENLIGAFPRADNLPVIDIIEKIEEIDQAIRAGITVRLYFN